MLDDAFAYDATKNLKLRQYVQNRGFCLRGLVCMRCTLREIFPILFQLLDCYRVHSKMSNALVNKMNNIKQQKSITSFLTTQVLCVLIYVECSEKVV